MATLQVKLTSSYNMGFFDVLLGLAVLNSFNRKRNNSSNNNYNTYNKGYNDGYYDAYNDRSFDNDCDCGYCSDHDYDDRYCDHDESNDW